MISVRKKRAVNLLAIVFLIVFFTTSCGIMPPPPVTQTESSQSEEREESSRSESPEEEPSQDGSPLEPKSEPKEDTIEKMELQTVDDLQFAVPESWIPRESGNITYYYPLSGNGQAFLMVMFNPIDAEGATIMKDEYFDALISGIKSNSEDYLELAKGYSSNKNGVEYAYLKYSCTAGGIDVVSDGCFFDSQRGVVSLCMGVSNTVKEDYSDIFAEIIHSVDKASGFM